MVARRAGTALAMVAADARTIVATERTPAFGADFGRVLAGFEVPANEMPGFEAFLEGLGYRYQRERENSAYDLFLSWQTTGTSAS